MGKYYPPLKESDIRLVMQLCESDANYFNDQMCPYSKEVKDLFRGEVASKYFDPQEGVEEPNSSITDNEISQEITNLYKHLKKYGEEVKSSEKSADKNTFFRISTSLLEKMIELRERMSNLHNVNSFIAEVLQIMDEILTPDQRTEVTDRLAKLDMKLPEKKEETNVIPE